MWSTKDAIQGLADGQARHAGGHLQQRTLATPLIHDREHPELRAVGKRIMDKIHAPAFGRAARDRRGPAMQCHMLAPSHTQAYLQPFQAVQPPYALAINWPAFAA